MQIVILMGILRSFNILTCTVKLQEGFSIPTFSNYLMEQSIFIEHLMVVGLLFLFCLV